MAVVTTNLGTVTAYGDAVAAGYTGTKEQWQALMADYATVGTQAAQDAQTASTAASTATTAAQTATTKAGEASASAEAAAESAAAIGTPDTTLTQSGIAADAKAVGDELSTIKEDLTSVEGELENCIRYDSKEDYPDYDAESEITFTDGYAINTDGSVVAVSGYAVSDLIPLENIYQVYRYGTLTKFSLRRYALYDEDQHLLQYYASTTSYDFTTINGRDTATEYNLVVNGTKASYIRIEKEIERTMYHFVKVPSKNVYYIEDNDIVTDTIEELKTVEAKTKLVQFSGKTIVNLGDSIFGATDDSTSTSAQIGLYVNATVINCAFGGSKACDRNNNTSNWRAFDLLALSASIASGDWTAQDAALTNSDAEASGSSNKLPSYFADRLTRLKAVDFSKVDIVTFNYGTNDYTDSADERTLYKTRLESCVKAMQTAFPNILFVGVSPTWRIFLGVSDQPDSDTYYASWSGGQNVVLPLWCEAMKDVCEDSLHIPYIDCYNIGINRANYTRYFPTNDGTHHNANGRARLGEHVARGLMSYC